jgi:hypothetical protein
LHVTVTLDRPTYAALARMICESVIFDNLQVGFLLTKAAYSGLGAIVDAV